MKKKIGLGILVFIELVLVISIYLIGGRLAPWMWSAGIFIIAPVAGIAFLIQLVVGLVRVLKKKSIKWNVLYGVVTLVMAYPITILFGTSALTYPTKADGEDIIEVINPVENSVLLGGREYKTHAVWPSECYAYDIVKEPYDCGTAELGDYGIYLADVYAPISGTIIALEESEEDIPPNTEEFISSLGNYVFMRIESTDTYLILAHLEKDSIAVSVGDFVAQGDLIGKVGNSGTTSEPHLHMQHQKDNPLEVAIPICAEGLPMKFVQIVK